MKKAKKTLKRKKPSAPKKSGEIAVSYAALSETEQSLKHEITSVKLELRSVEKRLVTRIDSVEAKLTARIDSVEAKLTAKIDSVEAKLTAKIDAIDAKFDAKFGAADAKFASMDAKLEQVLAAVHRVAALVEEQNSRNRFVLDGYTSLHDSQEEIKARLNELEKKGF